MFVDCKNNTFSFQPKCLLPPSARSSHDLRPCACRTQGLSFLLVMSPGPRAAIMASQVCISRDSVVSLASLHPCQQAARFLVHTRPPDHQDKPYSRTVLTRVEFEMLTRHSASRPRTPGRIHSEDHILSPRFSPPSSTG